MAYGQPANKKQARKPFEVKLSKEELKDLGIALALNVTEGLSARSVTDADVMYWHTLYEQGRTRGARNSPWADAADLTSHIGTEKVDAMRARIVKTLFTEPVWTVEGWGSSEAKAPFVEEFHQWQQEEEGFQGVCARAIHLALIEPRGVLEVYEDTTRRPVRQTIKAKLQLAPDGSPIVDEELKPQLEMGENGQYAVAEDENTPAAEVEIDSYEVIARGPRHRTIPYRDFLVFPAHATDKADIWGYGKRFFRRVEELQERAKSGVYDKAAVDALGTDDEHQSETTLSGTPLGVPPAVDGRAEKELWELLVLKDCGEGLRWYVGTIHVRTQRLLRFQVDDIGRPRYFSLVPFPRPNSTEGYSFIGNKLITVIEEHTAWRNMDADRGAMQLNAPIKLLQGALWDPDAEPIGAKSIIPVRSMTEVEPLVLPDVTGTAVERIQSAERAAERIAGITDAAAGVRPEATRTLGETNLITEQSFVRMDEAIKNIQETLEEIGQVRHVMWKRALAEMGDEGLTAPPSVQQALTLRGAIPAGNSHEAQQSMGLEARSPDAMASPSLKFTADMLEGTFRFKPRGSVETADKNKMRQDFGLSMQAIVGLSQVNASIGALLQAPSAAKALIETWVRLFHVNDKQAFLGSEAQAAMQQQQMQPAQMAEQMKGMQQELQTTQQKLQQSTGQAQQAEAKHQQAQLQVTAAKTEVQQHKQAAAQATDAAVAQVRQESQVEQQKLQLQREKMNQEAQLAREKMQVEKDTKIEIARIQEEGKVQIAAHQASAVKEAAAPKKGSKKHITVLRGKDDRVMGADVEDVEERAEAGA